MNILGIDFGTKRLGTAVGNTETGIAFPREIVNFQEAFGKIKELCQHETIDRIIVGLPILPGGGETQETTNARMFADDLEDYLLAHKINTPVEFWDERYSTKTAGESMKKIGISEHQFRGKIDSSSAAVFLQVYLDFLAKKGIVSL